MSQHHVLDLLTLFKPICSDVHGPYFDLNRYTHGRNGYEDPKTQKFRTFIELSNSHHHPGS